jgi:two-component system sensor histidine kinase BaeS
MVEIASEIDDLEIRIIISDSSPTVGNEQLPKLFDRLYRTDKSRNRSKGGSGLGLAICKNIVEAHQGTIEAEAARLGGLQITIFLPIKVR